MQRIVSLLLPLSMACSAMSPAPALAAGSTAADKPAWSAGVVRTAHPSKPSAPGRTRQSGTSIPVAAPDAVAPDVDALVADFDRWVDVVATSDGVIGLAAAIVKDERVVIEKTVGFVDAGTREPVEPETVFRVASLSKAFAAALTGLLVEEGRVRWDTRVSDLLPAFMLSDEEGSGRVGLSELLSHRLGLPFNTFDRLLERNEPYERLVGRLHEVRLTCPVGECYAYQNVAFSLIGDVVYATTGDFFAHQVEKRIFHPLGMRNATYGRQALLGSRSWARPHRREGDTWLPLLPNDTYYRVAPAAGVNASLRDMEKWLIAQFGTRPDVLSPALLATLHGPLVETRAETRATPWRRGRLNDARYALGWRVYDYAGVNLLFHAGAVRGYRAMIAFLPDRHFGVVMLWNSESATPAGLLPMVLDRYLGLPYMDWAGVEELSPATEAGKVASGGTRAPTVRH